MKNALIKAVIILNQANHYKRTVFSRQVIKSLENIKDTILLINFL